MIPVYNGFDYPTPNEAASPHHVNVVLVRKQPGTFGFLAIAKPARKATKKVVKAKRKT